MRSCAVVFAFLLGAYAQEVEPSALETSYQNLQKAVQANDAAQVKKLAAETNTLARAAINAPAENESEKASHDKAVAYAKEVDQYTEYALYTVAVQAQPATAVELFQALEQQSPKSKYLDEGYVYYFDWLTKAGAASKIPGIAAKALANFPSNEDLLLIVAESALSRKQNDAAITYADRMLGAVGKHAKPEGMSAADWERKKAVVTCEGYYIGGVANALRNKYPQADKSLRAALPLLQGDTQRTAYALFYLGISNYQLGKMTMNKSLIIQGAKFSDQAAAIKSPVQDQAYKNAALMRAEAK